jgi:hypothetical protein
MEVEATSVFHAAIHYCGACAARTGSPPRPEPRHVLIVRVDGKEYRVREQRVRDWANAKAGRDARARLAAERKRKGRR